MKTMKTIIATFLILLVFVPTAAALTMEEPESVEMRDIVSSKELSKELK